MFLVWGGNGWIASQLVHLLRQLNQTVHTTTVRMENRESVQAELSRIKPTHVLNCAGVTGRPNVDWCEGNKEATIRSNVIGTLNLADCCYQRGIHCTIYATGCEYIYVMSHILSFSLPSSVNCLLDGQLSVNSLTEKGHGIDYESLTSDRYPII